MSSLLVPFLWKEYIQLFLLSQRYLTRNLLQSQGKKHILFFFRIHYGSGVLLHSQGHHRESEAKMTLE